MRVSILLGALLPTVLLAAAVAGQGVVGEGKFAPEGIGFEAEFPGPIFSTYVPGDAKTGDRDVIHYVTNFQEGKFSVIFHDLPGTGPRPEEVEGSLLSWQAGSAGGGEVFGAYSHKVAGYPARSFGVRIKRPDGKLQIKLATVVIVVGNLYECSALVPEARIREPHIKKFIDSFKVFPVPAPGAKPK
jgi:hypothetical protein